MSPFEAIASLSTEAIDALARLNRDELWLLIHNEHLDRGYIALVVTAAAPDPPYDQLTDDDTAEDIDRLLGDDA